MEFYADEADETFFDDDEDLSPEGEDDGEPAGSLDLSDDADALASAGMGTDEDYGSFGGEDDWLDGSYEGE